MVTKKLTINNKRKAVHVLAKKKINATKCISIKYSKKHRPKFQDFS
jgi:hypothetical protein